MFESGLDVNVSRETVEALRELDHEILTWSRSINLISKSTFNDSWSRHILDSAQLFRHSPESTKLWLDIGSGGGLPGLVVSILAKELRSAMGMILVESDTRKAAFLKLMVGKFGLNARVLARRVEDIERTQADIVSARALASLTDLISIAHDQLVHGGTAIFPKGRGFQSEIDNARTRWDFVVHKRPSLVDAESRILLITEIQPKTGAE